MIADLVYASPPSLALMPKTPAGSTINALVTYKLLQLLVPLPLFGNFPSTFNYVTKSHLYVVTSSTSGGLVGAR